MSQISLPFKISEFFGHNLSRLAELTFPGINQPKVYVFPKNIGIALGYLPTGYPPFINESCFIIDASIIRSKLTQVTAEDSDLREQAMISWAWFSIFATVRQYVQAVCPMTEDTLLKPHPWLEILQAWNQDLYETVAEMVQSNKYLDKAGLSLLEIYYINDRILMAGILEAIRLFTHYSQRKLDLREVAIIIKKTHQYLEAWLKEPAINWH